MKKGSERHLHAKLDKGLNIHNIYVEHMQCIYLMIGMHTLNIYVEHMQCTC